METALWYPFQSKSRWFGKSASGRIGPVHSIECDQVACGVANSNTDIRVKLPRLCDRAIHDRICFGQTQGHIAALCTIVTICNKPRARYEVRRTAPIEFVELMSRRLGFTPEKVDEIIGVGQAARRPRPRCASMARSNTASMSCSVVVLASKYTTIQYQPGGKARTSAT